jgi:DNA-binding NarL/FixJ family response regulator
MNKPAKLKVFIVDDHAMVREGIKAMLQQDGISDIVYEAENGRIFLDMLPTHPVDVVLMDIEMPEINGIETTAKAMELAPDTKILVLTMFASQEYYTRMITAGAKGFILKSSGKRELEYGLRAVAEGDNYFSGELLQKIIVKISSPNEPKKTSLFNELELTDREIETLQWLCNGYSTTEIAEKLHLSARTIESHRAKLLLKTGTKNTINLVMYAIKNKLVNI